MYKIDFAKQLDAGTSNVEVKGEVTFAKDPMNFKSKPEDKKQYDFWSQWIFLRDETESMGVSLSMGEEGDRVNQGDRVKVRGKVDEYSDRDGITQKKLMGKIVKPKEEVKTGVKETKVTEVVKKTPVEVLTTDEIKERGQIEKRDIRVKATEISSKLVVANKLEGVKELFSFAEKIVRFIYYGYGEESKGNVEKPEGVEKIGKKEKLEARVTPDEILKTLSKEVNLQTWKEILHCATLANICPVEATEEDIQRILTDNSKLIQKVINTKP
ncbi:hypothetical protein ES708_17846 [subsurface metagenome]